MMDGKKMDMQRFHRPAEFWQHRVKRSCLLAFLCLAWGPFARAQEMSVQVKADTSAILIGDQIGLNIEVYYKPGIRPRLPVLADTLSGHIQIVGRPRTDTLKKDGNAELIRQRYMITSFDSGTFAIPPLVFLFNRNGQTDTLLSAPQTLSVNYPPADSARGIYDVKPPMTAHYTLWDVLRITGYVILALMALSILLYVILRLKHRKKGFFRKEVPPEPAHVIALRELDRLKEEKLWQQGQLKEYYTRLTEIIRKYVEGRYGVPAMEQTSMEILENLKFTGFEDETTYHALEQLLMLSDLVKFAKELPLPDKNESNMLNAYVFVNHTKQQTTPAGAEKNEPAEKEKD